MCRLMTFLRQAKCFAILCVAGGCSQDQSEVRLWQTQNKTDAHDVNSVMHCGTDQRHLGPLLCSRD